MRAGAICTVIVLLSSAGWAQKQAAENGKKAEVKEAEVPSTSLLQLDPLPLQILSTSAVQGFSQQQRFSRTSCDADGNIFITASVPTQSDRFRLPAGVMRISKNGQELTPYLLSDIPELQRMMQSDRDMRPPISRSYSVTPDGNVYLMVLPPRKPGDFRSRSRSSAGDQNREERQEQPQFMIAVFRGDGGFQRLIKLDPAYLPQEVVPLLSGQMLVAGRKLEGREQKSFVGLFKEDGQLVREFGKKEDEKKETQNEGGRQRWFNMSPGFTRAGEDGNIYVLPSGNRGPLQVFTSFGEFMREIKFDWPKEARIVSLSLAAGFLAAEAITPDKCSGPDADEIEECKLRKDEHRPPKRTILLYSLSTGELLRQYDAPSTLGTLACYTPEAFTFLRTDEKTNELSLVRAAAR